ncbi:MAG: hypothetical protein ACK4IK_03155 [Bacteroidia bacterium]
MEPFLNKPVKNNRMLMIFRILAAIIISLLINGGVSSVFAQTDSAENKPVANEAMKNVFQQMKKEVKSNDTLSSILMIIGVVLIVGVAVYLSFKSSPEDKKASIKGTSPKKA